MRGTYGRWDDRGGCCDSVAGPASAHAVLEHRPGTDELRRSILDAELEPGAKLSLRQLADQLGVSVIRVREALRSLEMQGLVVSERGRTARVAELEIEQLHSVYRLRKLIEPDICRRAVPSRSDYTQLEHLLEQLGRDDLSSEERTSVHSAFHIELMAPATTEWDLRVLEMLWTSSHRYVTYAYNKRERDPAEAKRRYDAHRVLLDAARSGDANRLADTLVEHLDGSERLIQQSIDNLRAASEG